MQSTITIPVDSQVAQAWNAADEQGRLKMQTLVNLWLEELVTGELPPLEKVMDEVGRKAQARGLTEEILDSILRDD